MSAPKTTKEAIEAQHEAKVKHEIARSLDKIDDPLGAFFERREAADLEKGALDFLDINENLTEGSGEASLEKFQGEEKEGALKGWAAKETLENPDRVNVYASRDRMQLALDAGCLDSALDASQTVKAQNSLEKMLAHQMAGAHSAAMKLMARALDEEAGSSHWRPPNTGEMCRVMNTAARLMETYQKGLVTIARVRTAGRQIMTVQHVNVGDGGQAVVAGNMETRRKRPTSGAGSKDEQ